MNKNEVELFPDGSKKYRFLIIVAVLLLLAICISYCYHIDKSASRKNSPNSTPTASQESPETIFNNSADEEAVYGGVVYRAYIGENTAFITADFSRLEGPNYYSIKIGAVNLQFYLAHFQKKYKVKIISNPQLITGAKSTGAGHFTPYFEGAQIFFEPIKKTP